jgi:hypothetical protein
MPVEEARQRRRLRRYDERMEAGEETPERRAYCGEVTSNGSRRRDSSAPDLRKRDLYLAQHT